MRHILWILYIASLPTLVWATDNGGKLSLQLDGGLIEFNPPKDVVFIKAGVPEKNAS